VSVAQIGLNAMCLLLVDRWGSLTDRF